MSSSTDRSPTAKAPCFHAQFGEDRALLEFFGASKGFYVDVGANDGLSNSNTATLDQFGWRGILVEADPDLVEACRRTRPAATTVACAAGDPERFGEKATFHKVSPGRDLTTGLSTLVDSSNLRLNATQIGATVSTISVPVRSLNSILVEHSAPTDFQLLSVDVEGAELDVLKSVDLRRWRPRVIIVEDNSAGSDKSVRNHLRLSGYYLAWRTGVNNWYVRLKDMPRFAGRRLRLAMLHLRWAADRRALALDHFFRGQESGFFVQLGFEFGADPGRSPVLERDAWRGLLVEMDLGKCAFARQTRGRLQVVCSAICPLGSDASERSWVMQEPDWLGFTPHTCTLPKGAAPPAGAVKANSPQRTLGNVLLEQGVPESFDLLAIGPSCDAADAVGSMDWKRFRPRLVLIDSRAPGQAEARLLLESAGWRQVHWKSMCFWFVQPCDTRSLWREWAILKLRVFLWSVKRLFGSSGS